MPPPNLAESLVAGFLTLQLALLAGASRAAESDPLAELARPGRLLLLRHANAPGIGDPAGFALADCRSQRNLDAAGRGQAARRVVGSRRVEQGGGPGGPGSTRRGLVTWAALLAQRERLQAHRVRGGRIGLGRRGGV